MLLGTHFRSQGEIAHLLCTFPLGLPSTRPGMGLLGSGDEGDEGGEEEIRKIYLSLKWEADPVTLPSLESSIVEAQRNAKN